MPDIARWGEAVWGEERWGQTDGGAAHILEANFGAAVHALGSRLGANHPLDATAQSRVTALGVGAGPAPIHPLRATAISTVALPSLPTLRFLHQMDALFATTLIAQEANMTMSHKLAASAIASIDATGRLRIFHPLDATFASALLAAASDLDLSHPLDGVFSAELNALARYAFEIPETTPLGELNLNDPYALVPGAVNLAANDSVENDLLGWYAENGATVTRVLSPSHDGVYAARFQTPGIISTERGAIRSYADLNFTPYPGSLLWGECYLAATTPIVLRAWMRATFLDGSIIEGDLLTEINVTATGLLGDWMSLVAPPIELDGTKTLRYFELLLAPDAPSGSSQWWADSAFLEYDAWMYGPRGVSVLFSPVPDEEEGELPIIEEPAA